MTTRPELFRVRAMECQIAAQKAKDPDIKEAYLDLMRGWHDRDCSSRAVKLPKETSAARIEVHQSVDIDRGTVQRVGHC